MTGFRFNIGIFLLIASTQISLAQKVNSNYLLAYCDSSSGQKLWGFKTTSDKVRIEPKYDMTYTDTMIHMAFVTLNDKWVAINTKDSIILTPYILDYRPDPVQEGLFRFLENGKIGFANLKGQKVIPAKFDFASEFLSGLASFNVGGKPKELDSEHSIWSGGLWGFINKHGLVVINPEFTDVDMFFGSSCEAWTKNNRHVLIDKKGKIIKVLPQ